jgi:alkylated DNA repair dioxygenase AlkB
MMLDLFEPAPLPGLATRADLVNVDEERDLIAAINAAPLAPFRFGQWTGNRLTASYGWGYDFQAHRPVAADPIPEWLLPLRHRMAKFAHLDPNSLIQALLIRYDPGAGIGWHRDRPIYEHILGLSLGAPATMRFRRRQSDGKFRRATLPLEPRAAYRLSGEARHQWEHSIAEMDAARWSITFRSAVSTGR